MTTPTASRSANFSDIVYGRKTPYGWSIEYSDIDNIQRQDLIDFYHRYYFPANIMLEDLSATFHTAEMKAKLEQLFGIWKVTQPPVPAFPKVTESPRRECFWPPKTDTTQTFFHVGHLGGELRDKDYPALEVASEILGGGFSSRLFQQRSHQAWLGLQHLGVDWDANYDHPGTFQISRQHAIGAHRGYASRRSMKNWRRSAPREVTDEELQTAKDTVLNGFVFNFDRPSKTSTG